MITVDMEGIAGVQHNEHTSERGYDYAAARGLMIGEANAAVAGAVEGGATHVLVADQHGGNGARNLLIHDLHPAADLLSGYPRPLAEASGLLKEFDVLLAVGAHTRHGAFGVLNHTIHGRVVDELKVGGTVVGEVGIHALLAGDAGIPLALVTGDDRVAAEASSLLPQVETAVVKWAIHRFAARCLSVTTARETVRRAARRAVERAAGMAPYKPGHPTTWEVRFKDTGMAEAAAQIPGAVMAADDVVAFEATDACVGFRVFTAAVGLASGTLT